MADPGGPNVQRTSVMNASGQWASGPLLDIPRGYSSATLTSQSKIFTLVGSWSDGIGGKKGELLTPGGSWTVLPNLLPDDFMTTDPQGTYLADNHMWLHGASNGWGFHAGPSKKMRWINTAGAGSVVNVGLRGDDGDAMNRNYIPYDVNKLLTVAGAPVFYRRAALYFSLLIGCCSRLGAVEAALASSSFAKRTRTSAPSSGGDASRARKAMVSPASSRDFGAGAVQL